MKEMKKSIVDETVGTLAAELESQELGEVNGGGSPAIISAITAITALSHNVTGRMSDKRNCGAYWTVSYECFGFKC